MGGRSWNAGRYRRRCRRLRADPSATVWTRRDAARRRRRPRAGRSARAGRARPALCRGSHGGRVGRLVLGMTARRAGVAALALGLITAALLHGRMDSPPVYDGIIVPPEPYRWESPPPNLASGNKPPLSGETTLPIQNGQVAGGGVQTGDNQAVIYFGPGAFKAPAGATGVRCSIAPDPNPPAPSGAPRPSIFSDLGRFLEFFGILAFVILFGAIAVLQEIRRRRHRAPAPAKRRRR